MAGFRRDRGLLLSIFGTDVKEGDASPGVIS